MLQNTAPKFKVDHENIKIASNRVKSRQIASNRVKSRVNRAFTGLIGAALALALTACGGGGGGDPAPDPVTPVVPTPSRLSGVAAVGAPIVNGVINIRCAGGGAPAATTTTTQGAWQVTLTGQTLPCAVQVTGGTVSGVANTTPYHSIATALGTVNVTPFTDLLVANLTGTASPSNWFSGVGSSPAKVAAITSTQVTAAVARFRAAMAGWAVLNGFHPITTVFTPTAGNGMDAALIALRAAMTNTGVSYASLLGNAATPSFSAFPVNFNTSVATVYSDVIASATQKWVTGSPINSVGAQPIYGASLANLGAGKLMAVHIQGTTAANAKVYASLGSYATGAWETPVDLSAASVGDVQVELFPGVYDPLPVLTANAISGDALAAWTTRVGTESKYRVWVSTYTSSSGLWSSATTVGFSSQKGVRATHSAAGGMAIAWVQPSTVKSGQMALGSYMVSRSGAVSTDVLELGVADPDGFKIGLSNADMLVVAWNGATQQVGWETSQQIMLARRGTPSWAAPVVIGAGVDLRIQDLSISNDGSGAAVMLGAGGPHAAVFDAAGVAKSSAIGMCSGQKGKNFPVVAASGGGRFIMAFHAQSGLNAILCSAAYNPTVGWSAPGVIANASLGTLKLQVSDSGSATVVIHGSATSVYRLVTGASGWTGGRLYSGGGIPELTLDPVTGRVAIVWATATTQLASTFYR